MTIKTSASAGAQQAYGGFWIRFLAYLVDSVILFIALVLIGAGSAFLGPLGALVVTAFCIVGPVLYWAIMQASARQATYGKALLGLKVADQAGHRISFVRSLARELAKIISAFALMIGFLIAAFTKRKQALHDLFATTTVVREGPRHLVAGLAIGLLGWVAPIGLVMVLGAGLLAGMIGTMGGDIMEQAMKEAQKQAAQQAVPQTMPPQKPPAPPPAVVAKAAPPPAAAPVPVAAPAPVPVAPPPPVVEPKPEPVAVAAAKPKPRARPQPAPLKVVAVPQPAPIRQVTAGSLQPDLKIQADLKTASAAPKYNDLMTAVLYQDADGLNQLLAAGKWADKPDSRGVTPLMAAVMLGDAGSAEALLKAGADAGRALPVARERGDGAMMNLLEKYTPR